MGRLFNSICLMILHLISQANRERREPDIGQVIHQQNVLPRYTFLFRDVKITPYNRRELRTSATP